MDETLPPPPPTPRTRGYLCSFPITRTPPPYLGYWLPLAITKTHPFPGFLGKSFRDYGQKRPPFPRKWECTCCPLMHSSGGPGGRNDEFVYIQEIVVTMFPDILLFRIFRKKLQFKLTHGIPRPPPPHSGVGGTACVFPKSPVKGYFRATKSGPRIVKKGGVFDFSPGDFI